MKWRRNLAALVRAACGLAAVVYAVWMPSTVIEAALRVGAYRGCEEVREAVPALFFYRCERPGGSDFAWIGQAAWPLYVVHYIGVAAVFWFFAIRPGQRKE